MTHKTLLIHVLNIIFFFVLNVAAQASPLDTHQREHLKGYQALQENNYERALEIYRKLTNAGHVESSMDLGVMFLEGWGTPKNPEKALELFRRAGTGGSLRAQILLGMILLKGMSSVPPDPAEAATWIEKAANQGHIESTLKLARMHERGLGIQEDLQQAYIWYGRAAKLGDPKGKEKQVKLKKFITSIQAETANRKIEGWTPKPTSSHEPSISRH